MCLMLDFVFPTDRSGKELQGWVVGKSHRLGALEGAGRARLGQTALADTRRDGFEDGCKARVFCSCLWLLLGERVDAGSAPNWDTIPCTMSSCSDPNR